MSRQDILNVLQARAAAIAAKYGITPEDAFIQAYELWCFLADQNLIGAEFTLEYTMRSPSGATINVKPGPSPTSYQYHMQYTF